MDLRKGADSKSNTNYKKKQTSIGGRCSSVCFTLEVIWRSAELLWQSSGWCFRASRRSRVVLLSSEEASVGWGSRSVTRTTPPGPWTHPSLRYCSTPDEGTRCTLESQLLLSWHLVMWINLSPDSIHTAVKLLDPKWFLAFKTHQSNKSRLTLLKENMLWVMWTFVKKICDLEQRWS